MGEKLFKGNSIISSEGMCILALQFDNNLVLYKKEEDRSVTLWRTSTNNVLDVGFLRLDEDGNLCLYKTDGISKVWESHTSGSGATRLTVENSGEVSLFDSSGNKIWNARRYEGLCQLLLIYVQRKLLNYKYYICDVELERIHVPSYMFRIS